ncbi:unnamed protein product [Lepeophtheirus salmonis]|uniref:(salmon louse) hypothetical protein n=1 Tax=Lepeophtheirus salmonis TaxID=72036 RepID=A0A7R8D1F1_LEPSM|nr:unnamed protein product [Lepeophtheirus salmonis]CAF2968297.1 unnamed protein product [Lepeophtheirus salmonis]
MMMESLEMSESSKLEESSHMRNRVTTPILPKGEIRIDEAEEEEEEDESITLSLLLLHLHFRRVPFQTLLHPIKPLLPKLKSSFLLRVGGSATTLWSPCLFYKTGLLRVATITRTTPSWIIPFYRLPPFTSNGRTSFFQIRPNSHKISLQTPSGTSVVGDFASSQDDDQQRLTSGGRSEGFRAPRLPCFILFWLVLLLRIYLPVNYFGLPPKGASSPTAAVSSSSASRNITNDELDSKNNSSDSSSSRLLRNSSSSSPSNSSSTSTLHYNHSRSTPYHPNNHNNNNKQSSSPSSDSTTTSFSSSTRKSPTFSSNPSTSPLKSTFYTTHKVFKLYKHSCNV